MRFGDGEDQEPFAVRVDARGDILLAGAFNGTVDLGGGPLTSAGAQDVFVAKLRPDGRHVWSRSFGNRYSDFLTNFALDTSGSIYMSGDFSGDLSFGGPLLRGGSFPRFLVKLDGDGNHVWSRSFEVTSSSRITFDDLAATADGQLIATGDFRGEVRMDALSLSSQGTGDNAFIARFDATGAAVWARRHGTTRSVGSAVAVDEAGSVHLWGSFYGTIEVDGGPLVADGEDIFWMTLSRDGALLRSRSYPAPGDQTLRSLALDGGGHLLIAGESSGAVDLGGGPLAGRLFLAALTLGGEHVVSRSFTFTRPSLSSAPSVAFGADGDLSLAGSFSGALDLGGGPLTATGDQGFFVGRLDSRAAHEWSALLDTVAFGTAHTRRGIQWHPDGSLLIAVPFSGSSTLEGHTLTSAGRQDIALFKLQ